MGSKRDARFIEIVILAIGWFEMSDFSPRPLKTVVAMETNSLRSFLYQPPTFIQSLVKFAPVIKSQIEFFIPLTMVAMVTGHQYFSCHWGPMAYLPTKFQGNRTTNK